MESTVRAIREDNIVTMTIATHMTRTTCFSDAFLKVKYYYVLN